MKQIFKFLLASVLIFNIGCSDDDTLPVDIEDLNVSGGPFAQQILSEGLSDINLLDPSGSNFTKTYQLISLDNGNDISLFEVFVNATRLSDELAGEQLLLSIPASEFDTSSGPFPQVMVDFAAEDILNLLGLTTTDLEGGDQFNFRLALTNPEGTFSDVSANFANQSAQHTFISNVICLNVPVPGDWTLEMTDLYGDGWNGGQITVNISGESTTYSAAGFGTTVTITIPEGTTIFTFTYTSGDWEGENLYTLTDPNGMVVLNEGVGDGSQTNGPPTGELLNNCPE
ncbi:hypothetical protein [uncultured Winogradskyella sp.]|uniref:hypothetical protein n=1 Tax=uncultured Winogradskyella sp. TaxID=395353 RepID=UPI00262682AC|nr:hypothetical protein [uncultured Winogradskyella sp.]